MPVTHCGVIGPEGLQGEGQGPLGQRPSLSGLSSGPQVSRCPLEQVAGLLMGHRQSLGVVGHSQRVRQELLAGRPAGHLPTVLRKGRIDQLQSNLGPLALLVLEAGADDGLDQPM
jgi:hypothetical protein